MYIAAHTSHDVSVDMFVGHIISCKRTRSALTVFVRFAARAEDVCMQPFLKVFSFMASLCMFLYEQSICYV